jgi:hypothetical protein
MMRRFTIVAALLLAAPLPAVVAAEEASVFAPQQVEGAELRFVGQIPVAIFTGTASEIGRQHAALLANSGEGAMEMPRLYAAQFGLEAFWPLMAQAGRTLLLNAPQRHQEELHAIAQHSRLGDDRIAVANTLLELRRIGCSSLIVEPSRSATGGPLIGRNFDFPTLGRLHRYSLLMVYRPAGQHAFAAVGFPGLVGIFSGFNDAGLAVATLDVEQSADGSRKFNPTGTPLAFVFRRILEECTTIDEAEKLLRSETATTWMNLAVCDRDGGAVFEITPDHVARRDGEQGLVRCTNHFRSEGLSVGEACDRYEKLLAPEGSGPLDVAVVHARLDAARQDDFTLQTMVFEPRSLTLHLALGEPPSSDDPLTRIELGPLFEVAPPKQ